MASFYENHDPHAYQVMFRPKMSTTATPREWWKYAIRSVLFDLRKGKKHDGWQIALARNTEVLNNVRGIMNQIPSMRSLTYEQIKQMVDLSLEKASETEKAKPKEVKKLTSAQLEVKLMEKEKEIAKREKALSEKDAVLAEKEKEKEKIKEANNNLTSENDVLANENETLKKMMQMLLNPKHVGDEGLSTNDMIQYQLLAMEKKHNEELAVKLAAEENAAAGNSSNTINADDGDDGEEEGGQSTQEQYDGEKSVGHCSSSSSSRPHSRLSKSHGSPSSTSPEKVTSAPSPYDVASIVPKTLDSKYKDENGDVDAIEARMPKVVHLNYLQKEKKRQQELREKKEAGIVRLAEHMVAKSSEQERQEENSGGNCSSSSNSGGKNKSAASSGAQEERQRDVADSSSSSSNTKPKKVPSLIKKLPSPRASLKEPSNPSAAGGEGRGSRDSVPQAKGPTASSSSSNNNNNNNNSNANSKSPRGRSISPRGGRGCSPRGENINNANGRRGTGGRGDGGDSKVVQHQPIYLNKLPPEVRPNEQKVVDALSKFKTRDGMKKKLTKMEMNLFVSPFAKPLYDPSEKSSPPKQQKQQSSNVNVLHSAQLAAAEKKKQQQLQPQQQQQQQQQQEQGPLSSSRTENNLLPTGWVQLIDESSGHPYYLNELTGESQWEPPPEAAVVERTTKIDTGATLANESTAGNNSNTNASPVPAVSPLQADDVVAAENDGEILGDSLSSDKSCKSNSSNNSNNNNQSPISHQLSPIVRLKPASKGKNKVFSSAVCVTHKRKALKPNTGAQLPALSLFRPGETAEPGSGIGGFSGGAISPPTLPPYKSAAAEIEDARQPEPERQQQQQQQLVLISPRIAKSVPQNSNNRVKVKPLAHSKSVDKATDYASASFSNDQPQQQHKRQVGQPASIKVEKTMEMTLSDGTVVVVAVDEKGNPKQVLLAPVSK